MTMQTDVLSATTLGSGILVSGKRLRLKSFYITADVVDGVMILYDGVDTTGKVIVTFNTIGVVNPVPLYILIPGEGILCDRGLYASLTNIGPLTIFYG